MENNRNRFAEILALGAGLSLVGYILARAFSDRIGVDITAGSRLLFSIVLCIGLIAYAVWSELSNGFFGYRALMPMALSTLWSGLWPSMKYWGAKPLYLQGMPLENVDVQWWATTYMQWAGWVVLLFGGYGVAYWTWKHR